MKDAASVPSPVCFIAPIGARAGSEALLVARELRAHGIRVDVDTRGGAGSSIKAMLRRANTVGAGLCLVLGDTEVERGEVQVKNLAAHTQTVVKRADIMQHVLDALERPVDQGGAG
jgi:histidyl-tRNA synthetase